MFDSRGQIVDLLALLALVYVLRRLFRPKSSLPLPPGPSGLPFFGNALSIPKVYEWIAYHHWAVELGTNILSLNVMGQTIIILDKPKAVTDLLEKRSSIYSSRPHLPFVNDLIKADYNTGFTKYGPVVRQHRRMMHPFFGQNTSSNYKPQLVRATRRMMNRLLDYPKDIKEELKYMAGDAILVINYGLDVRTEKGAYYLEAIQKGAFAIFEGIVPGKYLVDFLPILKYVPEWMPGAGFQTQAREARKYVKDMVTLPFEGTKERMVAGDCPPCFVRSVLDDTHLSGANKDAASEEVLMNAAGTMYTAGADTESPTRSTTVATLASCVLGLLDRPDVLVRARRDLDRVIQPGQLPDFDDEASLPYITAIAKEALRWREVTPLALPHYVEVEDEYNGYRIPARSIILANVWAMLHDEEVYPDPFTFKPERFMNGDEYNFETQDPEFACWGFGRRICAGRYMAFASIWIAIASLIYAFNIEKEVDEDGRPIEPKPAYRSSVVFSPDSFPCRITPRSKELADLVRANVGEGI